MDDPNEGNWWMKLIGWNWTVQKTEGVVPDRPLRFKSVQFGRRPFRFERTVHFRATIHFNDRLLSTLRTVHFRTDSCFEPKKFQNLNFQRQRRIFTVFDVNLYKSYSAPTQVNSHKAIFIPSGYFNRRWEYCNICMIKLCIQRILRNKGRTMDVFI